MGKRNRSFLILGGLAAASALAGSASAFWNFFGAEASKPEVQSNNQSIKAEFNDAAVSEVFRWLRGQGIEFVVETTDIANRRITLSVNAKNKDALLKAIADALGFSVSKKDNTYVLKKESSFGSRWTEGAPFSDFKVFENGKDGKPMTKEQQEKFFKEFGDSFKVFDDGDFKFFRDMKEMSPEERAKIEKEMGELHKMFDGDNFKIYRSGTPMTEEERKKFEKEMEEFGKNFTFNLKSIMPFADAGIEKALKSGKVWENGKERELTKDERAKLEKELSEVRKSLENLPEVKLFGMSPEEQKKFEAEMKKFGETMKDLPRFGEGKARFFVPSGDGMTVTTDSVQKFKESMTPPQKELMKKQGYLKLSDLTDKQKSIFGLKDSADEFSITINDNGTKISIRNK